MKRCISMLLIAALLLTCVWVGGTEAKAATKTGETRAISIVFDNSGSMYKNKNQAWCRATYAIEVFASMLNAGDILQIYPMNPFEVEGKEYTMDNPLVITDASKASMVRGIYTKGRGDTHIESIDRAISGVKSLQADQKYVLVVSDGDVFYRNQKKLSKDESIRQLDEYFKTASNEIKMMYLGIGDVAILPNTPQSDVFVKNLAKNTEDVLSSLTDMCNLIFGRDTLPKNQVTGSKVKFNVSMKKLIVFVQGENISDLKLTDSSGKQIGEVLGTQQVKYSTKGTDVYDNEADTSLQGMIVTYGSCLAGSYNIAHQGKASSIEIYYEPDADLNFEFTDMDGNKVAPDALYEGRYMVKFGMIDRQTGEMISSAELGNPIYKGSYTVKGTDGTVKEIPIDYVGFNDSIEVPLKMGETFDAHLTVTYLSGYTISKNTADFGWPEGGLTVAPRPARDLKVEITGGDSVYPLQDLEKGSSYTVKVYYQGEQLTGAELEKVSLTWNEQSSNAKITKEFANDHYTLTLGYQDSAAPQNTATGECTVFIQASYTAHASTEARDECPLTYNIKDDFAPVRMELFVPETYIVIDELEQSQPIVVTVTLNDKKLTPEDFNNVELTVDSGGLEYEVTPQAQDSSFLVKLLPTEGVAEDDYPIRFSVSYKDHIGRETRADDEVTITLSKLPIWLKWLIGLALLLLLIIIIWLILHIRVFPAHVKEDTENCVLRVGNRPVEGAEFTAKLSGNTLECRVEYGGEEMGVSLSGLEPGKESFLYKPSHQRSIRVSHPEAPAGYFGDIKTADIDGSTYVMNKDGELMPKDSEAMAFEIRNDAIVTFSGKILMNGKDTTVNATIPITYKKT